MSKRGGCSEITAVLPLDSQRPNEPWSCQRYLYLKVALIESGHHMIMPLGITGTQAHELTGGSV